MRLTDARITAERYRGEPSADEEGRTLWPTCVIWDDEIEGFGIRVFPSIRGRPSRKDFIVTWRTGLKARTMAIGTYGVDCTLRQARRTAREALDLARRGQDPIEARQRALGIGTAEDLASRFLFEHNAAQKKADSGPEASPAAEAEDRISDQPAAAPVEAAEASVGAATAADGPATADVPAATDAPAVTAVAALTDALPEASVPPVTSAPTTLEAPPAEGLGGSIEPLTAPETPAVRVESARPVKRGPTRVRLLSLPDGLHREIDRRARAAEVTVAAYLQSLIDRDPATPQPATHRSPAGLASQSAEIGEAPGAKEIFARVRASQTSGVTETTAGSFDKGRGRSGE